MLPEVGASELIVIAIVALIVVGPKDLPILLRRFGQFMAKLRGMANEFRASFDEMARQSELDDLRKEVEAMRRGQFGDMADHNNEMRSTISEIETSMSDVGVQLHPPMSYQYEPAEPPPPPVEISEGPAPEGKPVAKKATTRKAAPKKAATKPKAAAGIVEAPKTRKRSTKLVEGGA
jgi:sec-independent protein translocase protein TatB